MKYKEEKLSRDSDSDDEESILRPYNSSHQSTDNNKETDGNQGDPVAPGDDDLPIVNLQSAAADPDEPVITHRRNVRPASAYESLDYDICENTLWQADYKKRSHKLIYRKDLVRWLIFLVIGIITALIACTIDIIIESVSAVKYRFLSKTVDYNMVHGNLYVPYLYWILTSILPVGLGAALVTYIEPVAAGSGIPQVKCYLNGVKVPRIVRIKTLTIKAVGVMTSVIGGLAGGKEGPMIHSGAVVAAGISQGKSTTFIKDFKIFRYFRDDHEKRDFVLGGAAAGVASAFGAPIGGVLFSLEEAASFWNQSLIWRILVSSTISSFTLNMVLSAYYGLNDFTFTGLFNLGKFDDLPYKYYELPIFVLMGVCGGLLGAMWNAMNTKINLFRARYIRPGWAKVLEAMLVSLLGISIACIMMYIINDCRPLGKDPTDYPVKLFCADNEYNAVAALWFQTPESTAKALFHDPPASHQILTVAVFVTVYYLLSCITFGLNVSLGIFIPTVLVGAAWGRLVSMILGSLFPSATFLNPGKYALIGAAAHMGGVLRMTISLTVILLETTGVSSTFAFPLIITLITGKFVGDLFNEGIYDIQIKINHVPMLPWDLPMKYHLLKASHVMSSPVVCVKLHENAKYIVEILKKYDHNGFPVVEDVEWNNRSTGRVCGVILRWQLIIILKECLYEEKKRLWESQITIETFRNEYPRYPSIKNFKLNEDKMNYTVNFEPFMNPSPIRVGEGDSVPRIFRTFRALGLRHMIVVDSDNRVRGIITRKDLIPKED